MRGVLLTFLLALSLAGTAQQLVVETGRVSTRLNYQNTGGDSGLEFFPENRFTYTLAYRGLWGPNAAWRAGMRYRRLAARASDPVFDRTYSWDAQYLGLHTQLDVEWLRRESIGFLWTGGVDTQWLTAGQQTVGTDIYDLRGVEQFSNPYLFLNTGMQARYCLDSHIAVTFAYNYGHGLPLGAGDDPESLRFNTHTLSLGLFISFTYCKYCFKTHFL